MRMPRLARSRGRERQTRPAPRSKRVPDRDEACPSSRAVLQSAGGLVERPRAPEHDGRRKLEREPLPVVELQRSIIASAAPAANRSAETISRRRRARSDSPRPTRARPATSVAWYPAASIASTDPLGPRGLGRSRPPRSGGRIVDRWPRRRRACSAASRSASRRRRSQPLDRELEPLRKGRAHVATTGTATVWTAPSCLNGRTAIAAWLFQSASNATVPGPRALARVPCR